MKSENDVIGEYKERKDMEDRRDSLDGAIWARRNY